MISFHTCPLASEEGKESGGMNVYVFELAKELVRQGHTVDMYTRSQGESNQKIVVIEPRLRLLHLKAGATTPLPKKTLPRYLDEFTNNFLSLGEKENLSYDVFHCHYYLSGLIGLKIRTKTKSKTPIVMSFHTLALMKNLVASDETEREELLRIEAEEELTDKADMIIAPSENEKDYLEYLYDTPKGKIFVSSPGVDTDLFRPIDKKRSRQKIKATDDSKMLLFVGRIEPLKGIDMLMYGLKVLKTKNPTCKVCLWIVGGDVSQKSSLWSKEMIHLKNLMHLLKIPMSVKFVGQQPQSTLPYFYNAADLVIMPSHYESFGMVMLEAMACGTPVITTNVAGNSALLDDNHKLLITTANNPLLLASQIESLLINDNLRKEISKDFYKKSRNYRWQYVAQKIISIYEDVSKRNE